VGTGAGVAARRVAGGVPALSHGVATGDLLVAGADLFLPSFALQGWLCAFIGFKVPRTFRGASFCSSCQAFGVL
jgi:hypothetical protein